MLFTTCKAGKRAKRPQNLVLFGDALFTEAWTDFSCQPFSPASVLLLFHRNPDLAVVFPVLRTLLRLAGIAVHFHIYAGSDLVIGVRRQPLGKNLLVQPLQCLRHPPGTREDRPGVGRNGPGGKAIGNLSGGVIKVFQEKRKKLLNNLCCFS